MSQPQILLAGNMVAMKNGVALATVAWDETAQAITFTPKVAALEVNIPGALPNTWINPFAGAYPLDCSAITTHDLKVLTDPAHVTKSRLTAVASSLIGPLDVTSDGVTIKATIDQDGDATLRSLQCPAVMLGLGDPYFASTAGGDAFANSLTVGKLALAPVASIDSTGKTTVKNADDAGALGGASLSTRGGLTVAKNAKVDASVECASLVIPGGVAPTVARINVAGAGRLTSLAVTPDGIANVFSVTAAGKTAVANSDDVGAIGGASFSTTGGMYAAKKIAADGAVEGLGLGSILNGVSVSSSEVAPVVAYVHPDGRIRTTEATDYTGSATAVSLSTEGGAYVAKSVHSGGPSTCSSLSIPGPTVAAPQVGYVTAIGAIGGSALTIGHDNGAPQVATIGPTGRIRTYEATAWTPALPNASSISTDGGANVAKNLFVGGGLAMGTPATAQTITTSPGGEMTMSTPMFQHVDAQLFTDGLSTDAVRAADPSGTTLHFWYFADAATGALSGQLTLPAGWVVGTAIVPHFIWMGSAAQPGNAVKIKVLLGFEDPGTGAMAIAVASGNVPTDTAAVATIHNYALAPVMPLNDEENLCINLQFLREGTEGSDTYTGNFYLMGLYFVVIVNKIAGALSVY